MAGLEKKFDGFVPGRWPIDAYGNGGFRFAEMSHRGAVLALPAGVSIWRAENAAGITVESLASVLVEGSQVDFLLIGTGTLPAPVPEPVRESLRARRITLEAMTTPAAIRTYHVLVGEGRRVAAALLPVESGR